MTKYFIANDRLQTRIRVADDTLCGPLYSAGQDQGGILLGRVIEAQTEEDLGGIWFTIPVVARAAILSACGYLMGKGLKIEAIKVIRQGAGIGLKEAKDFVEGYDWKA